MQNRLLVSLSVSIALLGAACGGSSKTAGSGSSTTTTAAAGPTTTVHEAKAAGTEPSLSAKMVCEKEAINAIYNSATGVKTVTPPKPSWDVATHVFACEYDYPGGAKLTLSVKEMSSPDETTAYFDEQAATLGKTQVLQGLGQGAFQVRDGSVVVRKDYKVLLVDVTKLPARFGVPADTRANVAINVSETILGCWTGA